MIQSAGNSVRKHIVCYIRRNATPHKLIQRLCVDKVRRNSCREEICDLQNFERGQVGQSIVQSDYFLQLQVHIYIHTTPEGLHICQYKGPHKRVRVDNGSTKL
jgi:hypothetical protein